jgi:hypothetical protein
VNWTKSLGLGLKAKTRSSGSWNENDEKNQFYFYQDTGFCKMRPLSIRNRFEHHEVYWMYFLINFVFFLLLDKLLNE